MNTGLTIRSTGNLGWTFCGVALLLAAGSPSPSLAEAAHPARSARTAIQLERVEEALRAGRVSIEGAEVRMLAENTSSIEQPRLEVRSVEPWGERAARVRLGCVAHEQCLPFYVGVTWADAESAKAALGTSVKGATQLSRGVAPVRRQPEVTTNSSEPRASQAEIAARPPVTFAARSGAEKSPSERGSNAKVKETGVEEQIHAGAHATLLLDGDRLHIKVPVICLEAGAAGRRIRVTAVDHKQTYLAEVVDGTLLKGTL